MALEGTSMKTEPAACFACGCTSLTKMPTLFADEDSVRVIDLLECRLCGALDASDLDEPENPIPVGRFVCAAA